MNHGFERGESAETPRPGSYAMVPSHGYDQPDAMTIRCDALTEFEWRRPDGTLLQSKTATSPFGMQVLLRVEDYRAPYDLYMREPGGQWRRTYEFRPHPSGRIVVTHVESEHHSHDWQESLDADGNHIGWQCAICKAITWPTAGAP